MLKALKAGEAKGVFVKVKGSYKLGKKPDAPKVMRRVDPTIHHAPSDFERTPLSSFGRANGFATLSPLLPHLPPSP